MRDEEIADSMREGGGRMDAIIITGASAKEIAALVLEVQGRQSRTLQIDVAKDETALENGCAVVIDA